MLFDKEPKGLEGINQAFAREIQPHLAQLEQNRRRAERKGYYLFPMYAAVFLLLDAIAFLTLFKNQDDGLQNTVLLGITAVWGAHKLAFWGRAKVKSKHKHLVVKVCSTFLNLEHHPRGFPDKVPFFQALSLLPSYDRSETEDGIRGSFDGISFDLTEAKLEEKRGSGKNRRYITVFRGFLFSIDYPKPFTGTTTIRRDSGILGSLIEKIGGPSNRVKLEDPDFESRFDVYGTDQVEARYLLTPAMMERIEDLSAQYDTVALAFKDQKLHVACKHHDLFEAGTDTSNLNDLSLVRRTLQELSIAKQFISTLKLDTRTRM